MMSTTLGSDSVDMSPNSSGLLSAIFLKIRLIILPDRVFGKLGVILKNNLIHYIYNTKYFLNSKLFKK